MATTTKAPATVTVDRETLFDLVAAFTAMNQLMVALADGNGDFPFVDVFDSRLTVVEGWLGASSGEPDKPGGSDFPFDDPIRVEIGKAAAAITREMLKAIVADPYEQLVPLRMTRPRLYKHQLERDAFARGGPEWLQKSFLRKTGVAA